MGLLMMNNTAELNSYLGYRTKSARKNQDTWDEANRYAGKCLMFCGILMIILLLLIDYFYEDYNIIFDALIVFILISLTITLYKTESRLRHVFFRDGKRKPNR